MVNSLYSHISKPSLFPQMQQYNIEQFCGQNKISKALPSHSFDMDVLFKHLLYDDSKRMVFCYVPKNGCSNMKRMMLILNGLLPPNASLDPYQRPSEAVLGSVSVAPLLLSHIDSPSSSLPSPLPIWDMF